MTGHIESDILIGVSPEPFSTVLHPECEKELLDLKKQNDALLTKVIHDLDLLREFGLELLGDDRVKKLKPDLFELRTRRGSDINRILFGLKSGRIILLATSFVKKTQRTPVERIELAERRLQEWEKRND